MAMGMSPEEYWKGDVWLVKDYREAYRIRNDENNALAWLNGLYVYEAFAVVMQNAFGKGKMETYPNEPHDLHPKEKTAEEIREEYYQRLKAWGERFNEHNRTSI